MDNISTQQGSLKVNNTSNGSSHIIPLSPLMVYHLCELPFNEQPLGLGNCPGRVAFHITIFTKTSLHYISWINHDSNILELHCRSLNLTPPIHFDNSTMQSLDNTYHLLDGHLPTQRTLSKIHTENTSSRHTWLIYCAFTLTPLNPLFISLLYCRVTCPILFQSLPQVCSYLLLILQYIFTLQRLYILPSSYYLPPPMMFDFFCILNDSGYTDITNYFFRLHTLCNLDKSLWLYQLTFFPYAFLLFA